MNANHSVRYWQIIKRIFISKFLLRQYTMNPWSRLNKVHFSRKTAFRYYLFDKENQVRIQSVLEILAREQRKANRELRILDIGCGDGGLSQKIQKLGMIVHGIDVSDSAVQKARKRGIQALVGNAESKLPYKGNFFDLVFIGETIEHLFDTRRVFLEINRVLNSRGKLVITTPNLAHLPERIRLLRGHNPSQTMPFYERPNLHIRFFTRESLERCLWPCGFMAKEFYSTLVVFWREGEIVRLSSRLLAKALPSFGSSIIMVAIKRGNPLS